MTAREWNQMYDAVESGKKPEGLNEEEERIYNNLAAELEEAQSKADESAKRCGFEPYKVRFQRVELETEDD